MRQVTVNAFGGVDQLEVVEVATPEPGPGEVRSEEHTSELQSLTNLVCRLLLEKKKKNKQKTKNKVRTTPTT